LWRGAAVNSIANKNRIWVKRLGLLGLIVCCFFVWLYYANVGAEYDDQQLKKSPNVVLDATVIAKGQYLATLGNCAACHTAPGSTPYAGGAALKTKYGSFFSPNITPHPQAGIGQWTSDDFWRAMHHGRSKDGRLLYPAFPYPNYTLVSRDDSDALFAYLRSIASSDQPNQVHQLQWPFSTSTALAVWRAMSFKATHFEADPQQSLSVNRGRYLLGGLGHCSACHGTRNQLGANGGPYSLAGSMMPQGDWYSPSLESANEAGVGHWESAAIVQLLKTGITHNASVQGPMAEVVFKSTQYWRDDDLNALALAVKQVAKPDAPTPISPNTMMVPNATPQGLTLYKQHCAACHGAQGQGFGAGAATGVSASNGAIAITMISSDTPGSDAQRTMAYPALVNNRAVLMDNTSNMIRIVLSGGFLPATEGNPRPYGMPPFAHVLNDEQIALILSAVRGSWGNAAAPVEVYTVNRQRQ
jgi:mono/diheme cytochrome c family protein